MTEHDTSLEMCPQCKEDLRPYAGHKKGLQFCLQCRFPLMLIAGKYRLEEKIDEGGFATVFRARHIHMTREPIRVVKILKPALLKHPSVRDRFFREVQVTSALSQQNPHIVRIYDDFGEISNLGYFYVMEHLDGQALRAMLDESGGLLPLSLCFHLFRQLCKAMQDAHLDKIIHRDLKPANLIIVSHRREPHHLKVIDFGIAKPMDSKGVTATTQKAMGTPAYMAPEQCCGEPTDARTDIYAMGIILYELLTGETPFAPRGHEDRPLLAMLTRHLTLPPPPLRLRLPVGRDVPARLEGVLMQALAKSPEDRFPDVEALLAAFEDALTDPAVTKGQTEQELPFDETEPGLGYSLREMMQRAPTFAHMLEVEDLAVAQGDSYAPRAVLPTDSPVFPGAETPRPQTVLYGEAAASPSESESPPVEYTVELEPFFTLQRMARGWLPLVLLLLVGLALFGWWQWSSEGGSTPADAGIAQAGIARREPPRIVPADPGPAVRRALPTVAEVTPDGGDAPRRPDVVAVGSIARPRAVTPARRVSGPRRAVTRRASDRAKSPRRSPRRRRVTPRKARPLAMCRRVRGAWKGFLRFPGVDASGLSLRFSKGAGDSLVKRWKGQKGICVGIDRRSTTLHIQGSRQGYIPCTLRLWGRARLLIISLRPSGGIEDLDLAYCLKK